MESKAPPATLIPPALAASPDYEVIQEINRGGMGVVYLVRNRRMDRLEALKVVKAELLSRRSALERFEREMRSAARLNHPNIVTAYSAPPLEGLVAFAMEFVDGTDLYQLVRIRGALPVSNACYYVYQAAQALQHAHDKQMVHRDIKPNNLMLTRDGKKQVVKILDFGLAKASSEQQTDGGLTGTGQMLGTPHYIAPEQTRDASKADIRADIYSLGCTLYYLLTGEPPFHDKGSLFEIMEAHHRSTPRPLNEVRSDVPAELAAVVSKMMAKAPPERYQKPGEMAEALRPWFGKAIKPIPVGNVTFGVPLGSASGFETIMPGETNAGKPRLGTLPRRNHDAADSASSASEHNLVSRLADPCRTQTLCETASGHERKQRDMENKRRELPIQQACGFPIRLWAGIAAGVLAAGLLAASATGVFTKSKTPKGILLIEVNEPDTEVFVDGRKLPANWDDDRKHAQVPVEPGSRNIEVRKDGFQNATKQLPFEDGDRKSFVATLLKTEGQLAGDERRDNGLGIALVWCPPGEYMMGSPNTEEGGEWNEEYFHVTLSQGFWLGKTEVTKGEWQRLMGTAPWKGQDSVNEDARSAVTWVDWNDADMFCRKLTDQERQRGQLPGEWEYTLPTQAQWEYACRAGTATRWSFGDEEAQLSDYCWFQKNAASAGEQFAHRVGLKKPNPWGLMDMHGNAGEWCLDRDGDPATASIAPDRMVRCGSWADAAYRNRSAARQWAAADTRNSSYGFRIALCAFNPVTKALSTFLADVAKAEQQMLSQFAAQLADLRRQKSNPEERDKLIAALKTEETDFRSRKRLPWSAAMRSAAITYLQQLQRAIASVTESFEPAITAARIKGELAADGLQGVLTAVTRPTLVGVWKTDTVHGSGTEDWKMYSDGIYKRFDAGVEVADGVKRTWYLKQDALVATKYNENGTLLTLIRCTISADGGSYSSVGNDNTRGRAWLDRNAN